MLLSLLRRNSSSSMSDSSTRHLFISELSCLKNTHSLILLSFPQCFYHGPKAVWTKLTLKMTENQAMQILVVKFWLLHVQSICEGLSLSENNSQLAVYIEEECSRSGYGHKGSLRTVIRSSQETPSGQDTCPTSVVPATGFYHSVFNYQHF